MAHCEIYVPGIEEGASALSGELKIDETDLQELDLDLALPYLDLEEDSKTKRFANEDICRQEVLNYGDECFLLTGVLTLKECAHITSAGEKVGFSEIMNNRQDYRSCQRISFQSPSLAGMLWERIKGQLKEIVIDKDPQSMHIDGVSFLMQGKWVPKGLNDVFRLCRYFPGGHFAPHCDGFYAKSAKERSLQTFMIYLNGDFSGGSTNFINPTQKLYKGPDGKYCAEDKNIIYRVEPQAGLALVFNHNRLHEGERLRDGRKYILRTDIMFENDCPTSTSSTQDRAVLLFQEADRLEASGKCLEAMELYRKAFKLCPELEHTGLN